MNTEWIEISRWLLALLGVAGVLSGVWITSQFNDRRETKKRRYEFITKQLGEFYAPLLSLRTEIRVLSELRVRIGNINSDAWEEKSQRYQNAGPEIQLRAEGAAQDQHMKPAEFDSRQFKEYLLPAYHKMVEVFRDKLWLAEPETRVHFATLVEFVNIWDRVLVQSLPWEVLRQLGHTEENLKPFYQHLQEMHDRLREALARGEP